MSAQSSALPMLLGASALVGGFRACPSPDLGASESRSEP